MTSQTPKKCYVENDFVVCFCGKCKLEDYKLPSDYLIMTSQTPEATTEIEEIIQDVSRRIKVDPLWDSWLRQSIHHQLQKARHDWLQEEIVRLEKDFLKGDPMHDAHQFYQVIHFNEAIQTIIDRYQAELNQDNK